MDPRDVHKQAPRLEVAAARERMSLAPPFEISNRFKAVAMFGPPEACQGAQGIVYKGLDKASQPPRLVAIKVFKSSAEIAQHEAKMMQVSSAHAHIIDFVHFDPVAGMHGCLVMEAAEVGCFFDYALPELPMHAARISNFMRQAASALNFLHETCGIAHLDVKLENMLLCNPLEPGREPTLKLADFGFATDRVRPSPDQTSNGTDGFRAPELYNVKETGGYDAFSADAWSFGVCIFILAVARMPFTEKRTPPPPPPELPTPALPQLDEYLALKVAQKGGRSGINALCACREGYSILWDRVDAQLKPLIESLLRASEPATRCEALRSADSALNSIELQSQCVGLQPAEPMDDESGTYEAPSYRGAPCGDADDDAVCVQGDEDEEEYEYVTVRSSGRANSNVAPSPGSLPLRRRWGAAA